MSPAAEKLPLWRLITALFVLLSMAGVLLALAPVYFEDYQLRQFIRSVVRRPDIAATPDESLRTEVLARARQLDLPVRAGDIQISHPSGGVQLQMKYAVQMNFGLYQVDLHFHPGASGK